MRSMFDSIGTLRIRLLPESIFLNSSFMFRTRRAAGTRQTQFQGATPLAAAFWSNGAGQMAKHGAVEDNDG